jgi:hypothetical protein
MEPWYTYTAIIIPQPYRQSASTLGSSFEIPLGEPNGKKIIIIHNSRSQCSTIHYSCPIDSSHRFATCAHTARRQIYLKVGRLVIASSALRTSQHYCTPPTVRLRRDHCDHTRRVVLVHKASEDAGTGQGLWDLPTPGCPVSQPPFSSACKLNSNCHTTRHGVLHGSELFGP